MIYWALLIHIYQPPFQNLEILQKVDGECYSKLFDVFLENPSTKLTLNINGSLTEFLHNYKFQGTIDKIKETSQKGQLQFTGSAMYHPILPLLPSEEIIRQINLNEAYNEKILGANYAKAKGFFPPEMAISRGVLDIIEKMGYKWALVSGIACPTQWPTDFYYRYKSLPVFFRDDIVSNEISFKKFKTPLQFVTKIKTLFNDDYYVITAMDGETYGHHIKRYEREFLGTVFKALESEAEVQMVFLDELLNIFKIRKEVIPINSSWSTSPENLATKNPYPLWAEPKNKIHQLINYLREIAFKLFNILEQYSAQVPEDRQEFYNNARENLDKGQNSDGAWWASVFNFNEDLIFRSTQFLVRSVINSYKALFSLALKSIELKEARRLYQDFKGNYANLLQFIANKIEERSRFKAYQRKIDDLTSI